MNTRLLVWKHDQICQNIESTNARDLGFRICEWMFQFSFLHAADFSQPIWNGSSCQSVRSQCVFVCTCSDHVTQLAVADHVIWSIRKIPKRMSRLIYCSFLIFKSESLAVELDVCVCMGLATLVKAKWLKLSSQAKWNSSKQTCHAVWIYHKSFLL